MINGEMINNEEFVIKTNGSTSMKKKPEIKSDTDRQVIGSPSHNRSKLTRVLLFS